MSETADRSEPLQLEGANSRLWLVITVIALAVISAATLFVGICCHGDARIYLLSLSSSAVASLLVYFLVSVLADPRRLRFQQHESIRYAIDYSAKGFRSLFKESLPSRIFDSSTAPTADFSSCVVGEMRRSRSYEVKGTSCRVASVRLQRAAAKRTELKLEVVRFLMVDPRESDLLKSISTMKFREAVPIGEATIDDDVARNKMDVYITLVMLHDLRHQIPVEVFLHRDLPFYRSEHFEKAVFLSYYVGPKPFHETLMFKPKSRSFKAYEGAKRMTRDSATMVLRFGHGTGKDGIDSETTLRMTLSLLGCDHEISELRAKGRERAAEIASSLKSSGVDDHALF